MTGRKIAGIVGFVIHLLIGALLIFGGCFVLSGALPEEAIKMNADRGLSEEMQLIACGQILTGLLLILPWTASFGTLLISSFFGGAICFHMQYNESYAPAAAFLILAWIGAALRHPYLFDGLLSLAKPAASAST